MSVLIKGMKMPKGCGLCKFDDYGYCTMAKQYSGGSATHGIASFCPLIEVPEPHGKLVEFIDVATYEDDDSGTEDVNLGEVFAAYFKMREAKPVIEAEGNEERETYCKNCDRSIYGKYHNCDVNIENNGLYVNGNEKCYCKIVDGNRAEKYPWEKED